MEQLRDLFEEKIDVCNIFISSFLYFRAAKVRAFLLSPNKSKKKITKKRIIVRKER